MRAALAAFLVAIVAIFAAAPAAQATDLSPQRATSYCTNAIAPTAASFLGANPRGYTTEAAYYGDGNWMIRIRMMPNNYADRRAVFFNCHVIGWDTGPMGTPGWSYLYTAPAPNWIINTDTEPYWQVRFHPFVDPWTGHVW